MGLSETKRDIILWQFRYRCFLCGKDSEEVHHLNFNTKDNRETNLLPLCKRHHKMLHKFKIKLRAYKDFSKEEYYLEPLWLDELKTRRQDNIH